jgi:DNA-directed RNA polymerase subunit RPC12/RpoP
MSEFKFACPICGQHITADSKDTGSQIACPTCFRKIVVPQAPVSGDPKFVVSASEVNKPRPTPSLGSQLLDRPHERSIIPATLIVLLVLACASGATLFALRGRIFPPKPPADHVADGPVENPKPDASVTSSQPEFTGTSLWTLDLSGIQIPDETVTGSLHQRAFTLDRATLTGSNLTLRVGRSGPIELGLNIYFFNRQAEELSGKTAEVKPSDTSAPRVVLRWKDAERTSETFRSGYALKVEFGSASNGAIPGKIFLSLPDESKSWVAGTFRAEIRKPGPARPRSPQQRQYQTQ